MTDEKKSAFSRFRPTFLTKSISKQQIVPKFTGGTTQTGLDLSSSYFHGAMESVDAEETGGEEQWVNIQHSPEISPPVQELDEGGLSRDWTIFLEAYRDEVVEKIADLHAMAKTDRSKGNRPILQQIQQREETKEQIVAAQDMTNGPHREILQIHATVTAKVRAVKEACKRCDTALREANAPAPAFEKAAKREALQETGHHAVMCFQALQTDVLRLRSMMNRPPVEGDVDAALRSALLSMVQNFLKELTEKGKLTMIKDIAKNEAAVQKAATENKEHAKPAPAPIKEGVLDRLQGSKWERRYYQLGVDGWLVRRGRRDPSAHIRIHSGFTASLVTAGVAGRGQGVLLQAGRGERYLLCAPTSHQTQAWLAALNYSIEQAGSPTSMPPPEKSWPESDAEALERLLREE